MEKAHGKIRVLDANHMKEWEAALLYTSAN
jgi:hypothetical protein